MSKRLSELATSTPQASKSPGMNKDGDNPLSKRMSRRKLADRGASFIDSGEEARERARANHLRSKSVLEHKKNQIGETIYKKHPGWVLMMDIQTGLRQSVGKSGELSFSDERKAIEDNLARHAKFFSTPPELPFPPEGSMLTQPHKTELFKFKNYSPLAFGHLRQKFGVDSGDYMVSLCNTIDDTGTNALRMIPTPGKSGSMFFFSQDTKYIIKTIPKHEAKLLRYLLPYYYEYTMQNTNTLLPRFYGLHRVKSSRGAPVRLLIMGNVFQTNKKIHERYDLKGSIFGRAATEEEIKVQKENCTYKDVDWRAKEKQILLPRQTSELFVNQLDSDCLFLANRDIMDYSLLVGIHNCSVDPENDCTASCFERRKSIRKIAVPDNHPLLKSKVLRTDDEIPTEEVGVVVQSTVTNVHPVATDVHPATTTAHPEVVIEHPVATDVHPVVNGDLHSANSGSTTNGHTAQANGPVEITITPPDISGVTTRTEVTTSRSDTHGSQNNLKPVDPVPKSRSHTTTSKDYSNGDAEPGRLTRIVSTFSKSRPIDHHQEIITTGGFVNERLVRDAHSEGKTIAQINYQLPQQFQNVDGGCVFQLDDGGMWSADGNLHYFIGIIDILMLYSLRKKLEHAYKSIRYSTSDISSIKPPAYAERFLEFIRDIVPEVE